MNQIVLVIRLALSSPQRFYYNTKDLIVQFVGVNLTLEKPVRKKVEGMASAAPIELKAVAVSDQRNGEPDDITQKSKFKY